MRLARLMTLLWVHLLGLGQPAAAAATAAEAQTFRMAAQGPAPPLQQVTDSSASAPV